MLRAQLLLSLAALAGPGLASSDAQEPVQAMAAVVQSDGWRAKASDNIAGISDVKKVSKPAVVDYDALLAATKEMKEIEKDRVDPNSTKGRKLRQQAIDRVTKAAEAIRKDNRYCSVWKKISHKDKNTKAADITSDVMAKLDSV
ncbi:MAG: hypothetical protein AAF682_26225 [Planctomycetota bacterium]